MTRRLEFTPRVKLAIYQRAGGPDNVRCEKCSVAIKGRNFEVDHILECWEMREVEEKRRPLTADDGQLLCIPCHAEKTGEKSGERAHGKRIQFKAANAAPKRSRPIPGSKSSSWKKLFDGTVVRR